VLVGNGLDGSLGPVVAMHDSFQSWFAPRQEGEAPSSPLA
jgi:hypothetical protein